MALKDIKTKIGATNRMHKVTRAMEAVSAVKMRKTQQSAMAGRPYARAALSILARLAGSSQFTSHPLSQERPLKNVAVVVITSDKGLAGALNSGVLKAATQLVNEYSHEQVTIYAYGKKGEEYFGRREYKTAQAFENKLDVVPLSVMETMSAHLSSEFRKGTYDAVFAVYSNFKSTFEQTPTVRRLLPLSLDRVTELVHDIHPVKGKWSKEVDLAPPAAYSVEPNVEELMDVLVPRLTTVSLYHMLLEAKASEHSARMVAMKNASDKSKEVARTLTRKFNKVRQAAITREVSEIVGGREALAT